MTPFRPSREDVGSDPYLHAKMVLFAIGAAFGVAGMVTGLDLLLYVGIAILVAGVLLRFRRPRREAESEPDEGTDRPDDDVAGPDDGLTDPDDETPGTY